MKYSKYLAIFIMLLGLGVIITAGFGPTPEIKFALALAGIAVILSGLIQINLAQEKNREDERYRQLIEKLEKIEKDIENLEPPKKGGVAIADIISSGLKFYSEHIADPKKEDKND